jgi:hypothetical protein
MMRTQGKPPSVRIAENRISDLTTEVGRLRKALEEIAAIPDEFYSGEWDEIEKARKIAKTALRNER